MVCVGARPLDTSRRTHRPLRGRVRRWVRVIECVCVPGRAPQSGFWPPARSSPERAPPPARPHAPKPHPPNKTSSILSPPSRRSRQGPGIGGHPPGPPPCPRPGRGRRRGRPPKGRHRGGGGDLCLVRPAAHAQGADGRQRGRQQEGHRRQVLLPPGRAGHWRLRRPALRGGRHQVGQAEDAQADAEAAGQDRCRSGRDSGGAGRPGGGGGGGQGGGGGVRGGSVL